jgi:hypothetical protein
MRTLNLLFFSIFLLIPSLFVTPSQQHQVIGAHEARFNTIPATQDGMRMVSYLKYYELRGKRDEQVLATARAMGDYLIKEDLTPDQGKYPRFTRSTGIRGKFPQPADA